MTLRLTRLHFLTSVDVKISWGSLRFTRAINLLKGHQLFKRCSNTKLTIWLPSSATSATIYFWKLRDSQRESQRKWCQTYGKNVRNITAAINRRFLLHSRSLYITFAVFIGWNVGRNRRPCSRSHRHCRDSDEAEAGKLSKLVGRSERGPLSSGWWERVHLDQ